MVLTTSSPFFQALLKRNQHPHPLIFMRNISSEDLGAIMDFLYLGEANLREENLESFLKIATDLQIKGLTIETQRFSSKPQPTEDQKKINIEVSPTEPKMKFDHIKENPILNSARAIKRTLHSRRLIQFQMTMMPCLLILRNRSKT